MRKLFYPFLIGALLFGCLSDAFATDYKKYYDVYPQGNFTYDGFTKTYENTLTSNTTSVTISNLAGNTTVEYKLGIKLVAGAVVGIGVRPNNDTGSNYGYQYLDGDGATVAAARGTTTKLYNLCYALTGKVAPGEMLIYAKSGYVRTALVNYAVTIDGTSITSVGIEGLSWNNTADEITSLVVFADDTNGLGTGTYLCLWGKEYRQ